MGENSIEEDIKLLEKLDYLLDDVYSTCLINDEERNEYQYAIEHLLSDYKRVVKENETYKKQYFCLIDKIENKIDKFDYEFEKAKRKNNKDRADYYWDLIINFTKLLESEE